MNLRRAVTQQSGARGRENDTVVCRASTIRREVALLLLWEMRALAGVLPLRNSRPKLVSPSIINLHIEARSRCTCLTRLQDVCDSGDRGTIGCKLIDHPRRASQRHVAVGELC